MLKSLHAPPEPRTVRGTIYTITLQQAQLGTDVFINDTNSSVYVYTKTYGPPFMPGIYSAVLNSSPNDTIYVKAWNATRWGFRYGLMNLTGVVIDVVLNLTRNSEAKVIIINPKNHTEVPSAIFNLTANITMLGNNGFNCFATISFNTSVFSLYSDTYTHYLGNINWNTSIQTIWYLTGINDGSSNFTVNASCDSDGLKFDNLDRFTVYNISRADNRSPEINIIYPQNNTRQNTFLTIFYNVSDASIIKNCSLYINNILRNTTNNPERFVLNNFSIILNESSLFYITCTDNSPNFNTGTSGIFNISLNNVPFISNLILENPINLIPATTKKIYCNGTITDLDGFLDIVKVNASFFQQGKQSQLINLSNNYFNSSCSLFNGIGNNIGFSCSFDLIYYANNGTWFCNVSVIDLINATNTSQEQSIINSLLAIEVSPSLINYGDLQILQISPFDQIINITNYGNVPINISIYSYAETEEDNLSLKCETSNISYEYHRFSKTKDSLFSNMAFLNNYLNPVITNLTIPKKEYNQIENSTKSLFFKLQIPLTAKGKCNGRLVLSAS
ncbi:MAG: hypothetical protein QXE31_02225 [Candidatus Woesearchaeota archaeon]